MPNCSQSGRAARPALLVANPLCSKKCVDRFRTRKESDRNWVAWLQIAFDTAAGEPRKGFMAAPALPLRMPANLVSGAVTRMTQPGNTRHCCDLKIATRVRRILQLSQEQP